MKRKRLWKPGGHPRRTGRAMRSRPRMAPRAIRNKISGKEAAHLDTDR